MDYLSSGINSSLHRCFHSLSFMHLVKNSGQTIAEMGSTIHPQPFSVRVILKTVICLGNLYKGIGELSYKNNYSWAGMSKKTRREDCYRRNLINYSLLFE